MLPVLMLFLIPIGGGMLYFTVIMISTLRLNSLLGDPNRTMAVVLAAMLVLPILVRRLKEKRP